MIQEMVASDLEEAKEERTIRDWRKSHSVSHIPRLLQEDYVVDGAVEQNEAG